MMEWSVSNGHLKDKEMYRLLEIDRKVDLHERDFLQSIGRETNEKQTLLPLAKRPKI
jgi:hypothetical protein